MTEKRQHFIRQIIEDDLAAGKHQRIHTRFPPEPNGYLHIGHAKAICLNFGLAQEYQGLCNLRFDDTNPTKEEAHYADAIIEDVKWLGFDWGDRLKFASSYFHQLYDFACELIQQGNAYVDELSADQIREYRGTLSEPGKNSPHRDRSIAENLELFAQMKAGEFAEGSRVLRAKIDMSSGNINLRDPVIYRIMHAKHPHTHEDWYIYPMYDFAHPLSDAIEGITHSLCSLEFQDHRPLYDWLIEHLDCKARPKQYEFARLNVSHTITSKRKLKRLVDEKIVSGWDDPRLPTIRGMRHRGYPAAAIRDFCESIGTSKSESVIDMSLLEEAVRDSLNQSAQRAMCVLKPLKIIIDNYPAGQQETLQLSNHPQKPEMGERQVNFSREIIIDHDDFMEQPEAKFFRLAPGKEVRLRGCYIIKCNEVIKNDHGEITELRCEYDPATLGKKPEGRKVKGVIHWLNAADAKPLSIKLYDRLFTVENPGSADDFTAHINPSSLVTVESALAEEVIVKASPGKSFQFERVGYFVCDGVDSNNKPVFNRVVELRGK